jgi:hypothetical protein
MSFHSAEYGPFGLTIQGVSDTIARNLTPLASMPASEGEFHMHASDYRFALLFIERLISLGVRPEASLGV